jgi:DNA (cytosine-5)-methyltransferase 1
VDETFPTLTNGTAPGHNNAVAVPYTLKVRSGCAVDSGGKAAGKGALIQTDKAATLSTVQDQYLFQPVDSIFIIDNIGGQAEYGKESPVNGTLRAGAQGAVAYVVENHPADSRVNLDESGKVQTLTGRMGTGGGNVPMVMAPFCKSARGKFKGDAETWKDAKVANTLNTFDQGEARANELVVQSDPVICLQGNGIDRAGTAGCNGKGWKEDTSYTLNTIDRPAVVYAVDQGGGKSGANVSENQAPTLRTTHGGEPAVAYGLDRASFNQGQNAKFDFSIQEEQQPTLTARGPGAVCCTTGSFTHTTEEVSPTLMARDYKDPTVVCTNYIVRRLTPTECARLQGFADWWSYIEPKDSLTDEEYKFWLEVRNTHAAINGRKVQDYTEKQMLTWYNKLYTDSAEYKMWGNGIALPTALYCMQGVAEALAKITVAEDDPDDWMN